MTRARPSPPRHGRYRGRCHSRFAAALLAVAVSAVLTACCPVPAAPPGDASGAANRADAAWLVRVIGHRADATRVEIVDRDGAAAAGGGRRVAVRPRLELAPGREVYLRGAVAADGTFRWVSASPLPPSATP